MVAVAVEVVVTAAMIAVIATMAAVDGKLTNLLMFNLYVFLL